MSLVRLLAAGKSLVGGQEATSRYRLGKHASLPKFISPKNPFTQKAEPPPAPPRAARPVRALTPTEVTAALLKETKKLPVMAVRSEARPAQSAAPRQSPRPARALLEKLNPVSLWAQIMPAPKPPIPNFNQRPIQSELSLDSVKVVRNDLSDSDLDFVPVKSSTAAPEIVEPDWRGAARGAPVGTRWDQLTARIFGAGET